MQIPSAQEEKARKALLLLGLSRGSGNSSLWSGRRVVEQKEIGEGTTTDLGLVFLSTAPGAGVGGWSGDDGLKSVTGLHPWA